jgi:hypothetical protein
MKRYVLLALVWLLPAVNLDAFEVARPAKGQSPYDPIAATSRAVEPVGIMESTLAWINPRNRDYGDQVASWRREVFENTLAQVYFWGLIALGMGLGLSVTGNGWLLRERDRRLAISADVVAQLFNAYIGSRSKALEVIAQHNFLVSRYDKLDQERQRLADKLARLSQRQSEPELDFDQAREERGAAALSRSEAVPAVPDARPESGLESPDIHTARPRPADKAPRLSQRQSEPELDFNQAREERGAAALSRSEAVPAVPDARPEPGLESPDIHALKPQLAGAKTSRRRRAARLRAQDNPNASPRARPSRSHDELESPQRTKVQSDG